MRAKLGRPSLDPYRHRFDVPESSGALGVTFLGVSTLLFDDGDSAVLFDGFFSRPSLATVALRRLRPDARRIDDSLARLGLGSRGGTRLEAVVPVHSHFDHVMDAAEVVRRTTAVLVGGGSTANVGRGAGLPEERLHVVASGDSASYGAWSLTFLASRHCPPDRFPGEISAPLVPPARAKAYACGEAWSVLVEHASGCSALVQGSAGFRAGALAGRHAEVTYLGVGQLGVQDRDYIESYWAHTVGAVGSRRVVLTHWDDFFRPLDRPLRALPYAGDDLHATMQVLEPLAASADIGLHFPAVWRREDPWVTTPASGR